VDDAASRTVLDLLPGPVFRFDRNLRHTYANPAACRALGRALDQVLGRTAAEVGIPPEIDERLRAVLATGQPAEHRAVADTLAGEVVFLTRFVPEFDARGEAVAVVGVGTDVTAHARAEQELRESERRHRLMVECVDEYALFQLSADGCVASWNPGAARIKGYTEAEALGLRFESFFPPEERARAAALLAEAAARGHADDEGWRVRKDGSRFWASITLSAQFGPGGAVVGFTKITRDLTDRKRAEEALRASEVLLRQFIKYLPAAVAMFDTDLRYLQASDRWLLDYGLADRDVVGRSHYDLFPDLPEKWKQVHRRVLAGGVERCAEDRFERADGSSEWIEWECRPWHQPDGAVGGLVMFGQVITARKRAEEELRESERRHRQVLADQTEVVCRFRPDGTVLYVNEVYCRTFRKRADEIVGNRWHPAAHPDDVPQIEARLEEMTPAHPVVVIENRVFTADGERWMEFVNRGFYDAAGALAEIQAVGRDVTDRRAAEDARRAAEAELRANEERSKYERQMLQAQKLESLGVLAGGIAHDFNNLLAAILGYASLGRMRLAPSDPLNADLKQIEVASQRAADLCAQMLAYAGRGQFVVAPLDMSALVHEMAQLLATALSKRAVLKFNLADHLSPLVADPTQVRQVVMNLITNASDAIGAKSGVITLTTGEIDADERYLRDIDAAPQLPAGRYVYLEVSDTGCGMSDETKAKIFDPFFTTKFTGRGLGLAAVLGIVRAHKGAVKVYSQVGKGTTFKVLFPVADGPRQPVAVGSRIGPALAPFGCGRKVLVVDDEEDVRVFARKALELSGFEVDVASDGRDGADAFAANPAAYELVLIDLTMPRMGGADAYREMRRARPDVRAILTSGFAPEEATSGFEGKGLAGFVRKPFRADELLKAVFEAVGP
jgi:PAS domain S-box-containing protein